MILTDKCKTDFKKQNRWFIMLLPQHYLNLVIFRWFNTKTNICFDIQNWQHDGIDYAITHPYLDQVYTSPNEAGKRYKSFDECLMWGIVKANKVYNASR